VTVRLDSTSVDGVSRHGPDRYVDDASVADGKLVSLLTTALHSIDGEAAAIGAATGDRIELVWRGRLAGAAVNERTVFYGASVIKQFIGVAAARTILERVARIDDPIARWLPELPAWMNTVRLDHLVHHTSGLPDLTDPTRGVPGSNAQVVERFRGQPALRIEPGARFAYNNAGYVLLAEALARSRRQPVQEMVAELVMPLGLPHTRFGDPAICLPDRPDPPGTIGDGGLWTSVGDLTRWLQACNEAAFGADTQQLSESTASLTDGSHVNYAWGVRVTSSSAGRMITHGGSWDTWLAKTVRLPKRHVAVAVLSVGSTELEVSRTGTDLAAGIASL